MARVLLLLYGLLAYLAASAVTLYLAGFLTGLGVPRTIDSGPETPLSQAMTIDLLLLALFGLQHSIMARSSFKARWTRLVPTAAERSTYVLAASLVLALLLWQWRPIRIVLWEADHPLAATSLLALALAGWALALFSTFLIDHFDLFGLRQVWRFFRQRSYTPPGLTIRSIYRSIRHPIMTGQLIAFWATPRMTLGHLLFALGMSAYIFLGIFLEERDSLDQLGPAYRQYRQQTPMLFPLPRRSS